MVRRLVEKKEVRWHDPEEGQLEARALAARQHPHLLERIVPAKQEPGEVPTRLARRDRDRLEERVQDRRARDGRAAQLGEIADLRRVAEREPAVERREIARDRPEQRRLPCPIRPDDPDPIAPLRGDERDPRHPVGDRRRRAIGGDGATPGQVADDEILDPDDDLARARRRPATGQRARGQPQLARGPWRLDPLRLEALEPGFVLVHLAELAVRAIPLDQLPLAFDRLLGCLGILGGPGVTLHPLAVIGTVVAAKDRQPPIAKLPDSRHRRVEEGAVVRGHEQ